MRDILVLFVIIIIVVVFLGVVGVGIDHYKSEKIHNEYEVFGDRKISREIDSLSYGLCRVHFNLDKFSKQSMIMECDSVRIGDIFILQKLPK